MNVQGQQLEKPHGLATSAVENHLLSIEAVASRYGVSTRTVRRWIERENLPVHHLPGIGRRGIVRIAPADLDNWLSRHRHDPEVEATRDQTIQLDGVRFMESISKNAAFTRKNTHIALDSCRQDRRCVGQKD